ncbi:MAG: cytochrome b/b6 domain-containing protein [Campylobacterales bacterium]|nr:cytochrome b/b6 domain-containing protein [Campylobacterales bacterium]
MKIFEQYSGFKRILHWTIFLSFFLLAYTETMNMYFYSKEAIMGTFENSFSMLGYQDIPPLDRLFIARLERRQGWMWHYYAGIVFMTLTFLRFVIYLYERKSKNIFLQSSLFITTVTLFLTGYSLWAYQHIYEWQNITRSVHHYATYALYLIIGTHLCRILYLEISKKRPGLISNMIGGKPNE